MSCIDISSLGGNIGPNSIQLPPSMGGGILKVPNINSTPDCNAYCSKPDILATFPNITYSSEVQVGGQLECLCLMINATTYAGLPASNGCQPCQKFPPVTPPPDLGTCGQENASNGFVSPVYAVAVNAGGGSSSSSSSSSSSGSTDSSTTTSSTTSTTGTGTGSSSITSSTVSKSSTSSSSGNGTSTISLSSSSSNIKGNSATRSKASIFAGLGALTLLALSAAAVGGI